MIWLLLNSWWLILALVALPGLIALVSGTWPALLALIRRLPDRVLAAITATLFTGIAISLSASWLVGLGEKRCREAQEAAEKKADAKAEAVAQKAQEAATDARVNIRKESDDAQTEVRTIIRTLPASCPTQPVRLRDLGEQAVQGARGEMLPAEGR